MARVVGTYCPMETLFATYLTSSRIYHVKWSIRYPAVALGAVIVLYDQLWSVLIRFASCRIARPKE